MGPQRARRLSHAVAVDGPSHTYLSLLVINSMLQATENILGKSSLLCFNKNDEKEAQFVVFSELQMFRILPVFLPDRNVGSSGQLRSSRWRGKTFHLEQS